MIEHLVFLLEEPSAEDLLRGILPRLIPETVTPHFLVFEGKQDPEKQLPRRMRGWLRPNSRFIVMDPQRNRSTSFRVLYRTLTGCIAP